MATVPRRSAPAESDYPDADGQPMSETPQHRKNLTWTIETLDAWFALEEMIYISGNMFIYYVPGDRLRHISPDVFVVWGIRKIVVPERRRFLLWEEGKGPDLAIEFTSESTREEDIDDKFAIYQNTLKVQEYFLFDPLGDYLQPSLKGYRLHGGKYRQIRPVEGRLPSKVLGLHLESDDWLLRLYDPARRQWLLTPPEERESRRREETARRRAETAQRRAEAENERLRRELETLRKKLPPKS